MKIKSKPIYASTDHICSAGLITMEATIPTGKDVEANPLGILVRYCIFEVANSVLAKPHN